MKPSYQNNELTSYNVIQYPKFQFYYKKISVYIITIIKLDQLFFILINNDNNLKQLYNKKNFYHCINKKIICMFLINGLYWTTPIRDH